MKRTAAALAIALALACVLIGGSACSPDSDEPEASPEASEPATGTEQLPPVPGAERAQEAVEDINEDIEQRSGEYAD